MNDLTVGGDLTVNGTTTTVNSTVTTLDDPIITLGGDTAPTQTDSKDRGVEFRYYDTEARLGFFGWDNSSNQFTFLTAATNTSENLSGTDGALRAGSLNLTGSGTALDVDNNVNIDGTLTVDGRFISNVAQGSAPFVVSSTTKVTNLNADLLDGLNTSSTDQSSASVVVRDSSGDFSAGTITADLSGNATTADGFSGQVNYTLNGDVSGSFTVQDSPGAGLISNNSFTVSFTDDDINGLKAMAGTGLVTRTAAGTYAQRSISATANSGVTVSNGDGVSGDIVVNVLSASSNAANQLVLRDASGDFAANEITADLVGNVTGDVTGDVTGTSSQATNIATQTPQEDFNQEHPVLFVRNSTASVSYQHARTETNITYNPFQNRLTVNEVAADVTGEVTLEGAAPASATATGTAGDIRYDADYIYICVATNTWKRSAITTW